MKRSTKTSLLMSVVAMLLCVSMLVGSTFAWFTDSVTATNNVIVAGNLDVELYYQNDETTAWEKATTTSNIFKKDTLWEPGHVEVIKLKVVNEGTLALEYHLGINIANEISSVNIEGNPFKLSDYIKFGVVEGDQTYTREEAVAAVDATATPINVPFTVLKELEPAGKADDNKIVTLVVYMPETVGNVANYGKGQRAPEIYLGVNVFANQLNYENDSFGKDYDEDALNKDYVPYDLPVSAVTDADQFENVPLTWGSFGGLAPNDPNQQLEAVYQFSTSETPAEAAASPYADWYVDYFVSLDTDLAAGDLVLGGNYGTYGWIGFNNPEDVPANTQVPLLGSVTGNGQGWPYKDIASLVGNFLCGVADVNDALVGSTFTVQLRITNPDNLDETYVVSETSYTFTKGKEYDPATSLYDTIAGLSSGDCLTIPAGTYITSGSFKVPAGVTIKGAKGANVVIEQTSTYDNIFSCEGDVVVENITFKTNIKGYAVADNTKNHDTDGDITLIDCNFIANAPTSDKNWGVYKNLNGDITVLNCTFDGYDNALCGIKNANGSTTVVEGCTFTNIKDEAIGYVIAQMPADFEVSVIANNTGLTTENVKGW